MEVDVKLENSGTAKEFLLHVVPRENLKRKPTKLPGIPLNILIIGIDSLSHASAKRKLPKIYNFLQELDAYIFQGHVVTGDGTTQQLTPMLTGLAFSEQYEARSGFKGAATLDGWTWIYKHLKGRRLIKKNRSISKNLSMANLGSVERRVTTGSRFSQTFKTCSVKLVKPILKLSIFELKSLFISFDFNIPGVIFFMPFCCS